MRAERYSEHRKPIPLPEVRRVRVLNKPKSLHTVKNNSQVCFNIKPLWTENWLIMFDCQRSKLHKRGVFMSHNSLLQRFSQVSGSVLIGASMVIGIFGHTVLNPRLALADDFHSGDISIQAANDLSNLANKGINPTTIAFTPNGGFAILFDGDGYDTSGIPQEALNELATLNKQKSTINTIAFTSSGEWMIVYNGNGFHYSDNFSQDVVNKLLTLNAQKTIINSIVFTPAGEWVIISSNGRAASWSNNFLQTVISKIKAVFQQRYIINNIANLRTI